MCVNVCVFMTMYACAFLCVRVCAHSVHVESEDNSQSMALFFHHLGFKLSLLGTFAC